MAACSLSCCNTHVCAVALQGPAQQAGQHRAPAARRVRHSHTAERESSTALHCVQVLNAIRDHMGLHDSQPFTEDDFTGELHTTKKAPPTADEAVASDVLRELYAVPQQRLWTVLRRYGLDTFMHNVDQNLNLPH